MYREIVLLTTLDNQVQKNGLVRWWWVQNLEYLLILLLVTYLSGDQQEVNVLAFVTYSLVIFDGVVFYIVWNV